jgi:hypothetical protein
VKSSPLFTTWDPLNHQIVSAAETKGREGRVNCPWWITVNFTTISKVISTKCWVPAPDLVALLPRDW